MTVWFFDEQIFFYYLFEIEAIIIHFFKKKAFTPAVFGLKKKNVGCFFHLNLALYLSSNVSEC